MDNIREIIEYSRDVKNKKDVMEAVNYLVTKNLEVTFPVLKDIFFHPLTHHEIRKEVGRVIAMTKSKPVYNLLLSHLILRNFSDLAAVITTLGEYHEPEVYGYLMREFMTCNFDAQMAIVEAIGKIHSVESLEFFSKVYNGEIKAPNINPEQYQLLKEKAGEELQNQVVDI